MSEILLSYQTIIGTIFFIIVLYYDVIFTIKSANWIRKKCKNLKECLEKLKKYIHWKSSNT